MQKYSFNYAIASTTLKKFSQMIFDFLNHIPRRKKTFSCHAVSQIFEEVKISPVLYLEFFIASLTHYPLINQE